MTDRGKNPDRGRGVLVARERSATKLPEPSIEGLIRVEVGVKVGMAELSRWSADQADAFFNGIAEVLAAANGQR